MEIQVSALPESRPVRKRALLAIAAVVVLGAIAYTVYWFAYLSRYQSTDDAYVQGNVVLVTPQVARRWRLRARRRLVALELDDELVGAAHRRVDAQDREWQAEQAGGTRQQLGEFFKSRQDAAHAVNRVDAILRC